MPPCVVASFNQPNGGLFVSNDYTEPPNAWQVYEMRKQEIILMNLSCSDYEQAIKQLLKELEL